MLSSKRERERLELSQRQLAALVGVGKTTIGEIERGKDCRTW
ncbi:MAG: helix-turn-helix transcriptional regulator [Oscillospiraceae bacterium]